MPIVYFDETFPVIMYGLPCVRLPVGAVTPETEMPSTSAFEIADALSGCAEGTTGTATAAIVSKSAAACFIVFLFFINMPPCFLFFVLFLTYRL